MRRLISQENVNQEIYKTSYGHISLTLGYHGLHFFVHSYHGQEQAAYPPWQIFCPVTVEIAGIQLRGNETSRISIEMREWFGNRLFKYVASLGVSLKNLEIHEDKVDEAFALLRHTSPHIRILISDKLIATLTCEGHEAHRSCICVQGRESISFQVACSWVEFDALGLNRR